MYGATSLQSTSNGTPPLVWNGQKEAVKLDSDDLDMNGLGGEEDKTNVSIYPWMTRVHSNNSKLFIWIWLKLTEITGISLHG